MESVRSSTDTQHLSSKLLAKGTISQINWFGCVFVLLCETQGLIVIFHNSAGLFRSFDTSNFWFKYPCHSGSILFDIDDMALFVLVLCFVPKIHAIVLFSATLMRFGTSVPQNATEFNHLAFKLEASWVNGVRSFAFAMQNWIQFELDSVIFVSAIARSYSVVTLLLFFILFI